MGARWQFQFVLACHIGKDPPRAYLHGSTHKELTPGVFDHTRY